MCRIYRWHSQLKASLNGPIVNRHPIHLLQSDLDSACGPHCALMALMIFGSVHRGEVGELAKARKNALASFWQRSSRYYFVGSRPRELRSLLEPYKDDVACRVIQKDRIAEMLKTLKNGGVCIVGISNADFSHWVLVVGAECRESEESPEKMLILDPGRPPIPLLPWNSTLSVKSNCRDLHRYETEKSVTRVEIDAVLGLLPRNTEGAQ